MKNLTLAATAALATLALTACDPNWRSPDVTRVDPKTGEVKVLTGTKDIEAGNIQTFPDVPLPGNHKIDLERSVIFNSANQALGKISTEGSGDVLSVFRFYEQKMPEQGWSLVNSFQTSTASMYYAKPGKFVAIIIEATGRNSSRVTINVGPE